MLQWLSGLFDDPAVVEARLLGQLLSQAPELPDWSVAVQAVLTRLRERNRIRRPLVSRVLDLPACNALALPHATIVVAQSLVEFCRNERDQIAFVLAHEAAHIQLGHAAERARANALATVFRMANPLLGIGIRTLFDRAFSREQEFEADRVAAKLCARAGYAPAAATAFLARLGAFDRSTGGVRQFLSTHPPLQDRIEQLQPLVGRFHAPSSV